MLKNIILVLILVITCSSCATKPFFLRLSREISKQTALPKYRSRNIYKEGREAIFHKFLPLQSLALEKDTVFILENFEFESGSVYSEILTKNFDVSYVFRRSKKKGLLEVIKSPAFDPNHIKLVKQWDLATIKKKQRFSETIISSDAISAYRCYLINGRLNVDTISFKYFRSSQ